MGLLLFKPLAKRKDSTPFMHFQIFRQLFSQITIITLIHKATFSTIAKIIHHSQSI